MPKFCEDKGLQSIVETPSFLKSALQDLPVDVFDMDVAHTLAVLLQHPQSIAASIRKVSAIQTPANKRRIRYIEQSTRFLLGFNIGSDMVMKYELNSHWFERPCQFI
jgi:hypothetical protein